MPAEILLKARFLISSDTTDPSSFSAFLGVEATRTWLKGEQVHPKAINRFDHNGWVLIETDRGDKASLEILVNRLFQAIDLNRVKQLTSTDPSVEIELSIVVHLTESAPLMFLSSHQVKCLADIGAEIDVDIYPGT
jgi:hypothetical protein